MKVEIGRICNDLRLFTNEELEELNSKLKEEISKRDTELKDEAFKELMKVINKYNQLGVMFFVTDEYEMRLKQLNERTVKTKSRKDECCG